MARPFNKESESGRLYVADSTCKSTVLKIRQPVHAGRKLVGFLTTEQVRPAPLLLCLLAEILLIALLVRVGNEMKLQNLPPRVHEKTKQRFLSFWRLCSLEMFVSSLNERICHQEFTRRQSSVSCHFGGYVHLKCLSLHSTKEWNHYYICNICSFCNTAKSHTNQEQQRTSNNKPIATKKEQPRISNDPKSDVTKLDTKFQILQQNSKGLRQKLESIVKFMFVSNIGQNKKRGKVNSFLKQWDIEVPA